jgi:putative ABC transport system substrate-binding protein
MELLKEALQYVKRVAIVANPHHPGEQGELRASTAAAKSLGLAIDYYQVRNEAELENALDAIRKSRVDAIDAFPDALTMRYAEKIAVFAQKNRIPAISGWAQFAERGNLLSYGPNLRDSYKRLATYVDKIAKGAKPADLPVELPTSVEMVVNLRTAKNIGISVPNSILVRANKVIE